MSLEDFVKRLFTSKVKRKELKKNLLLEWSLAIRHFVVENKQIIMMIGGGIIVGIIILFIYISVHTKKVKQANELWERGVYTYLGSLREEDPNQRLKMINNSLNIFENIILRYKGTSPYYDALLYKGNILYDVGEYQKALDVYKRLYDENSHYYFAGYVLVNIAKCQEQLGNFQAAVDAYNKVIKKYKKKPPASFARYMLGQLYEVSGRLQDAVNEYQNLIENYKESYWSREASRRLMFLRAIAEAMQKNVPRKQIQKKQSTPTSKNSKNIEIVPLPGSSK